MTGRPPACRIWLAAILVVSVVLGSTSIRVAGEEPGSEPALLRVGVMEKMKTRNPLPWTAQDVWTQDVLGRVYDTVGKALPDTEQLVPYVIKGIDVDDDGLFETTEYGVFAKSDSADQLNITAYYDLNGLYFHDGVQVTLGDLFFSYHLAAMNPRWSSDIRPLMDKNGGGGSNYSLTRWLFILPAAKQWQNEPANGNASLRVAVRFRLQAPFALFYRHTLMDLTLFPRHVWEGTGWRDDISSPGCSMTNPCRIEPLHSNFGRAIYPETDTMFGRGVPTTDPQSFKYLKSDTPAEDSAEEWQIEDAEVIGTGPFRFESFDPVTGVAVVKKNGLFFAGQDARTGAVVDDSLRSYINQPHVDGILFHVYPSLSLVLLALRSDLIDFLHWSLPPEFVPDLSHDPNIRLWTKPELGFTFLGYDLRRQAVGYWNWGQADQYDVGLHFRKAIAHLIDKGTIVRTFLNGYGVPGMVPVNPYNTRFFNDTLSGYSFNETLARQEIDLAHEDAVWLSQNGGPPEASSWYTWAADGKLVMPGIGTTPFNLACLAPDYEVQRLNTCEFIAWAMREFGINVTARPKSIWWERVDTMFLGGWRIGTWDVGYLYDLFHSSNAASGHNYPGFNDPLADFVLEQSRSEMNESRWVSLLKWAQGILLDKLPYDTLYFRTNIEAARQDRFVGWIPLYGTIWNYWSLLSLWTPSKMRITATIEAPSAMAAGASDGIDVVVEDLSGQPIDDARVTFEVQPDWAGNFSAAGKLPSGNLTVRTAWGRAHVLYSAPQVGSITNVTITITARHPEYPAVPETSRIAWLSVFPVQARFLSVRLRLIDSDIVPAGDSLRLGIDVRTPEGMREYDAQIHAGVTWPIGTSLGVEPSDGNATEMSDIVFRAPVQRDLAEDETLFVVNARASLQGYHEGNASIGILAVKVYRTCPDGSHVPSDQECPAKSDIGPILAGALLVAVVAIAAVVAVVKLHKRRTEQAKRQEPPKG